MELDVTSPKKKLAAVIALGAIALLAGCGSATAAFTVGKNSTSVKDIQTSVDNILAARKGVNTTGMNLQTGAALVASQVQFLLITELLADTAKSVGVTTSPAELSAEKDSVTKQVGGAAQLPKALVGAGIDPKNIDLYFTSVIYSQKLSNYVMKSGVSSANLNAALTQLVSSVATKEGVTVNPRYGKWDPKTATIVPTDSTSGAVTSTK